MKKLASKSLTLENTFTDWVKLTGPFSLSLSGSWGGTITLQRTFDGGTTPLDVQSYTGNGEYVGTSGGQDIQYRVGYKTGSSPSGSAVVAIGQ